MKKLLFVVAIVSMVLLSFNAHSKIVLNGSSLNGKSLNGLSVNDTAPTVNLRGLAQAPLVKTH